MTKRTALKTQEVSGFERDSDDLRRFEHFVHLDCPRGDQIIGAGRGDSHQSACAYRPVVAGEKCLLCGLAQQFCPCT